MCTHRCAVYQIYSTRYVVSIVQHFYCVVLEKRTIPILVIWYRHENMMIICMYVCVCVPPPHLPPPPPPPPPPHFLHPSKSVGIESAPVCGGIGVPHGAHHLTACSPPSPEDPSGVPPPRRPACRSGTLCQLSLPAGRAPIDCHR